MNRLIIFFLYCWLLSRFFLFSWCSKCFHIVFPFFFVTLQARRGSVMSVETSPDIRRPSLFLYNMNDKESNGRRRESEIVLFFFCVFGIGLVFCCFFLVSERINKRKEKDLTTTSRLDSIESFCA